MDEIDVLLLDLLQEQADRTLRDLGDEVGLTPSAVQRRIAKYKQRGLLRTVSILEPDQSREIVRSIVLVTLVAESREHHRAFKARVTKRGEVQQCYAVSGRWDYVVMLAAPSVNACKEIGDELFKDDDNIRRYETLIVFETAKFTTQPDLAKGDRRGLIRQAPSTPVIMNVIMKPNWSYTTGLPS